MRKVFITGAPRSGTTILTAILQALGFRNATSDFYLANLESRRGIPEITKWLSRPSSEQELLKYPIINKMLVVKDSRVTLKPAHDLSSLAKHIATTVDIVFWIDRSPEKVMSSEARYFESAFGIEASEDIKQEYIQAISETRALYEEASRSEDGAKFIALKHEALLEQPHESVFEIAIELGINTNNSMFRFILNAISQNIICNTAQDRTIPELYSTLSFLLGSITREIIAFEASCSQMANRSDAHDHFIEQLTELSKKANQNHRSSIFKKLRFSG